jgi:uncharacterized SAM-binding protein YcdF (DUF218 family)
MKNISMKKKVFYIILSIIGISGIIDTLVISIFYSGFNTGVVLPGFIGLVILLYSIYKLKTKKPLIGNLKLRLFFILMISIISLSFIIVESIIISNSFHSKTDENAGYMIILGAGLRNDGMTPALIYRLNKGLEVIEKNPGIKVIVSGGKGFQEKTTEAILMKDYLVSHGVEPENILVEDRSTSTYENFIFSKKFLDPYNYKIYVVTNAFHTFRANLIAKRTGLKPVSISAKDPESVLINCYLREYFAVIKTLIFDRS